MWMFAYSVHVLSSWHDTSKKTFLGKQGKKTKVAPDPIRLILFLVSVLNKILYLSARQGWEFAHRIL